MKKLLLSGSIVALLLPGLALAANGDVTMDTTVVLSVNGVTLDVSGSTASIESIAVSPESFSVVLQPNSHFEVTVPARNQLTADNSTWQSVNTCDSSASVLGYDVESAVTVVISPTDTICADATVATATSRGDARGGGSTTPVIPVVTPVTPAVTNAAAIAAIKTQLVSLIQQLIVLLNQELQTMQASGGN